MTVSTALPKPTRITAFARAAWFISRSDGMNKKPPVPAIDMTGIVCGNFTVLSRVDGSAGNGSALWLCRCICGEESIVSGGSLRRGRQKRCNWCTPTLEQRMESNTKKAGPDECWEWIGGVKLYPSIRTGRLYGLKMKEPASRVAYRLSSGFDIPDGMFICHKCDNPRCVNPAHLFLGTPKDNTQDKINKGRGNNEFGEGHHAAKLTDADVIKIIQSSLTVYRLAKIYKMSQAAINAARVGLTWKHLNQHRSALRRTAE